MSRKSSEVIWKSVCCLALACAVLAPAAAPAQVPCDDNARADFAAMVAAGATEADLEAKYGHCRDAYQEPVCSPTAVDNTKGLTPFADEIKVVTNFNTFYERMNGCGYHPQAEMLACDVEIRQLGGYGGFPGGTFEHIRFCMDCDRNGTWDYTTLGFVHVTNNATPGPVPPWFHLAYATTFAAPALCTNNDGRQTNVRAILSWAAVPANCNSQPFWGNRIDFTARRDP
jgi:hypothetical protein